MADGRPAFSCALVSRPKILGWQLPVSSGFLPFMVLPFMAALREQTLPTSNWSSPHFTLLLVTHLPPAPCRGDVGTSPPAGTVNPIGVSGFVSRLYLSMLCHSGDGEMDGISVLHVVRDWHAELEASC